MNATGIPPPRSKYSLRWEGVGTYLDLGGGTYPGWGGGTYPGRRTYSGQGGYLSWPRGTYPGQGVPTLARGTYPGQGGVPTPAGGTYPGQGYLSCRGVPTLAIGYLLRLVRGGGTYLGQEVPILPRSTYPGHRLPTLAGERGWYLPWPGGTYPGQGCIFPGCRRGGGYLPWLGVPTLA